MRSAVEAGAPLADVQSLIDAKNQQFAFEPVDISVLLGSAGAGTIGGIDSGGFGVSTRSEPDLHTVRTGLNYRF